MPEYTLNDLIQAVNHRYNIENTRAILNAGVDVNTVNPKGLTPLMFAVMPDDYGDHTHPEAILHMVRFLLQHGANKSAVDSFGKRAQDYAFQLIDPAWKDQWGNTAADCWDTGQRNIIETIIDLLDDQRD
ncbi:ankyrin repeat domain-containing protein [Gimesia chilikensis]|uniref:Ankyrin repeats (3 copies) n=1 Tax=Gimesia chilikensis TaxID=2605989 RepID=A0A517PPQ2_9PLAN|nr:ankyrin repeat domain-containing protein [Gimesia chilikensis]QDT21339.1 Ankyrin repeats (3 copies) [Gimesia chilikensis]